MEPRIGPDQAYQIRQKCFSAFQERAGFSPGTLRQKILALLSWDYDWWPMFNMVLCLNEATSISQRIGEMINTGIEFDRRHFESNHYQWKLITGLEKIDLLGCHLRPIHKDFLASGAVELNPPDNGYRQADKGAIASAAPTILQMEMEL